MREALEEARRAEAEGEVPIGAVAVRNGRVVARGHNRRRALKDITAHAEMMALRDLSTNLSSFDLHDITIYSTLEPCAMCSGAMLHYGVGRVVYGAKDLKLGAVDSVYDVARGNGLSVTAGVLSGECSEILLKFFQRELGYLAKEWEDIALE